jgi:hypothetical protein
MYKISYKTVPVYDIYLFNMRVCLFLCLHLSISYACSMSKKMHLGLFSSLVVHLVVELQRYRINLGDK